MAMGLVKSGMVKLALVIASDTMSRHAAPGTVFEYSASAGAVALLVAGESQAVTIDATASYVTDLSDYFRCDGERYIRPGGLSAMETEVGARYHIAEAVRALLDGTGLQLDDFDHAVFHQHFGIIPLAVCHYMGVDLSKVAQSVVAYEVGDCGSASSLLGLANVLDSCEGGERILLASYGYGAGSDAFALTVGDGVRAVSTRGRSIESLLNEKTLLDYATAMKYERKYIKVTEPFSPWM
jgi:hydroxymethylglutaryl-CoA synthase